MRHLVTCVGTKPAGWMRCQVNKEIPIAVKPVPRRGAHLERACSANHYGKSGNGVTSIRSSARSGQEDKSRPQWPSTCAPLSSMMSAMLQRMGAVQNKLVVLSRETETGGRSSG